MSRIKGPNFGVRFYRRGGVKSPNKNDLESGKAVSQDNIYAEPQPSEKSESAMNDRCDMGDIVDPSIKEPIHAGQELTCPRGEHAAQATDADSSMAKERALWTAARAGDLYMIRRLVMDGVDLDARDAQGRTAINIATQYSNKNALKTLLAAKEMRYMASLGELPQTSFFRKFAPNAVKNR